MVKLINNLHSWKFVLFLLVAFTLFSMPTMMIVDQSEQTSRSHFAHDAPNSVKATKRTAAPSMNKLLLFAALLSLFVLFSNSPYPPYRMPHMKSVFLPLINLRLRKILLMPLKFTSCFVSYSN